MSKKIVKIVAICLVMAISMSLIAGCNNRERAVRNLLNRFQSASNEMDVSKMLDCINPTISEPIRVGLGLISLFTQTDTDEILDRIAGALTGDFGLDGSEFFSSIEIELLEVINEGRDIRAVTIVKFRLAGRNVEREAVFYFIERSNDLYISSFSFR